MTAARLTGSVRIVGTGLLGTSIGLALRHLGIDVVLANRSPAALRLAIDYGAGRAAAANDNPTLVIVAVSPDSTADLVAAELAAHPDALVTDVASVKSSILVDLQVRGADITRYLGSHPMAGRERGGAMAARADIFLGRPWVIASHALTTPAQERVIESLALDLGSTPIRMSPDEHDRGVALVSHVPQVVASLLAARLLGGGDTLPSLAGQGLRDTTRIAGSDPELWIQILGANAGPVAEALRAFRNDLDGVVDALDDPAAPGAPTRLAAMLTRGNQGVARIPGKHGSDARYETLVVQVADEPGELARLLTEIGEEGVNMEDLRLEHSPGAQIGFAEIAVVPEAAGRLAEALETRGWQLAQGGLTQGSGS
ncbi:prephenate dehydrogenase [Pseudolysinimonas sp.]|uniref:prephenate dehydrogenase n=1 Tax=Pseudolysinimonas sp. TaxID=2680009 RepID=UPI00286B3F92|nr:prephenate dehydrogenase [Pseudolysinimonas sp.]